MARSLKAGDLVRYTVPGRSRTALVRLDSDAKYNGRGYVTFRGTWLRQKDRVQLGERSVHVPVEHAWRVYP